MPPRARKPDQDPADETAVESVEETDDNGNPEPEPETEPDSQFEAPKEDHSAWPQEPQIAYKVPSAARSEIARQLLDAADELGYPQESILSQTDGFLVPSEVHYHLFPSQKPESSDTDE